MTNPGHIVAVSDFSTGTLQEIIAHLEVSTEFEFFLINESKPICTLSPSGCMPRPVKPTISWLKAAPVMPQLFCEVFYRSLLCCLVKKTL